MKVSMEVDLLLHLGEFFNANLLERGVYRIRVSMACGTQRVVPVGMFTAPSTLDSFVGDQTINGVGMIACCEVDDIEHYFYSRAILIRYRGEKHELNEGVHWRFTIPDVDIPTSSHAPTCPQLLLVKFELLFADLLDDKNDTEQEDIMKLIPEPLNTTTVSLQNIGVQSITSGLHQYYAVSFDGDHFCSLDTMFHACITNLHYNAIIPPTEILASLKDQFGNQISDSTLTEDSRSSKSDTTAASSSTAAQSSTDNNDESNDTTLSIPAEPTASVKQPMTVAFTPTRRRVSTTIDSTPTNNNNGNTSRRSSAINNIFRFIASPEKTLFPANNNNNSNNPTNNRPTPSSSASTTSNSTSGMDDSNNANTSRLQRMHESIQSKMRLFKGSAASSATGNANDNIGLTTAADLAADSSNLALMNMLNSDEFKALTLNPTQALELFQCYAGPMIVNYHRAISNSQFILDEYVKWKGINETFQHSYDIPSHNSLHQSLSERQCILLDSTQDLEAMFHSTPSWSMEQLEHLLLHNIHTCNAILSSRLNIMFNALRRIMKLVRKTMKDGFVLETTSFWKQQMMIHTKSFESSYKMNSNRDEDMLDALVQHIKYERENDIAVLKSSPFNQIISKEEESEEDTLYSSQAKQAIPLYARGMNIFDMNLHLVPSRLPYLFVEQYMPAVPLTVSNNEDATSSTPPPPTNNESPQQHYIGNTKRKASNDEFQGKHLIILQHGFLGNSFDMRLVYQNLVLLCPKNTMVYCATSNEGTSQQSIVDMGRELANEVYDYCKEKCPMFLDKKMDQRHCRISFVGHSLGSLMIRAALQEKKLKNMLNKLHVFISLASPHLGNLFLDSQLVSTGMWALSKWKNCTCLKELVMEDDYEAETTSTGKTDNTNNTNNAEPKLNGGNKQKSYMYHLSSQPSFQYFKKVVLVSSPKDQYVPFYSARVQTNPRVESQAASSSSSSKSGSIVQSMAMNLMKDLQPEQVIRITILNYNAALHTSNPYASEKNHKDGFQNATKEGLGLDVNSIIGRAAHICYLESSIIAYQLVLTLWKYLVLEEVD